LARPSPAAGAIVSGDRILITGAAGFVGSAVARAAIVRGYSVRVLVRPESRRTNLEHLDVQVVDGDMRDERAMRRALDDARYLFHVAADYRLWAPHPAEIVRNNLEGTSVVMRAALAQHVERIVYTSSVATLRATPSTRQDAPVDETQPLDEKQTIGAYKRSKVLAERLVERMVKNDALPAVIVNPSTPIGAGDVRPTPTGQIIVKAARGAIPAFVDTGLNLVDVDDVANGHLLALDRGRVGERYILGGDNVTLEELLAEIARRVGRRAPRIRLPRAPLYPLALAAQSFALLTRREPFLTADGLKMSRNQMFFSSAKARAELGYSSRAYPLALATALDWFKTHGYLS
jgi:dihydroflavonol-4-reductase